MTCQYFKSLRVLHSRILNENTHTLRNQYIPTFTCKVGDDLPQELTCNKDQKQARVGIMMEGGMMYREIFSRCVRRP